LENHVAKKHNFGKSCGKKAQNFHSKRHKLPLNKRMQGRKLKLAVHSLAIRLSSYKKFDLPKGKKYIENQRNKQFFLPQRKKMRQSYAISAVLFV
jgi:hypothetical protein